MRKQTAQEMNSVNHKSGGGKHHGKSAKHKDKEDKNFSSPKGNEYFQGNRMTSKDR